MDPESLQQQATGCGLGLAILAAACRLPEVAQGREVRELVPVLLQVRWAGPGCGGGMGWHGARMWGWHGTRGGPARRLRLAQGGGGYWHVVLDGRLSTPHCGMGLGAPESAVHGACAAAGRYSSTGT